jgi:ABC-type transport system involved in multi-copper enzyme maturation permease subunit
MKALLRADWLRFRRRKDFWIIAIAVLVVGGVGFVSSYHTDSTDPNWLDLTPAQIREEVTSYSDFEGMTQAEIDEQIQLMVDDRIAQQVQERVDWEAQQAVALQKYDLAQTPFTLLGSGTVPILALVLMASLAVGDEFRFGTIRTSLLAAGKRRRFLLARLISLFAMTVGLFGAMVLLAFVLGIGLHVVGAEVNPSTIPIDPAAGVGWLGAQILATMVVISLGLALTVLLRSGALPLLLIIIAALVELFVAALPIFAATECPFAAPTSVGDPGSAAVCWSALSGVPQVFLARSIQTILAQLGADTHALVFAGAPVPTGPIELPLYAIAGIIAAWGLVFLFIADRRFRTMDVTE